MEAGGILLSVIVVDVDRGELYRSIFNARIREASVVALMPSNAAAPVRP